MSSARPTAPPADARKPGRVVCAVAAALMVATSACAGVRRAPEQFASRIDTTISTTDNAEDLEHKVSRQYCQAEKAYGPQSPKLRQVVTLTGETYSQRYMYLLTQEGRSMSGVGTEGLLGKINRMLGTDDDSVEFCG